MGEQEPHPAAEPDLPSEILPDDTSAFDPYGLAEAEFMRRVEALQEVGEMLRPSQIETQEELDEHFDELSRLYRQVCGEMDLPWPPPTKKLTEEELAESDLEESGWV